MRRLKEPFRRRSPVPPVPKAESSHSTYSDPLASVIKVLDVAEKALDGLLIPRLKQEISTVHTVLQSVEARSFTIYISDGDSLWPWFFLEVKR